MESAGENQPSLGKKLGIKGATVGTWLRCLCLPKGEQLLNLAAFFGVSMDWLLKGRDESGFEISLPNTFPEEDMKCVRKVVQILKNDKVGDVAGALRSNVMTFEQTLAYRVKIENLERAMNEMRNEKKKEDEILS